MNPATLSGAIDVIVVEQPDGTLLSTPFHVRFGKYRVFSHENKLVDIEINNREIDLKMRLGESGVAFFDDKTGRQSVSIENLYRTKSEGDLDALSPDAPTPKDVISVNDQTEKVPEDKLKLPFSSSIYSLRRNRSLPDLSIYESTSNEKSNNQELPVPRKKTHRRKATIGSIEKDGIISTGLKDSSKLAQTISSPYKDLSIETLKPTKRNRSNYSAAEKTTSTDDLSVSETRDRSSDLSSSNEKRSGKSVDDIADGALSDSEVDKHRRGSDAETREWKWGEIPEAKPKEEKNKESKRASGWSWLRWGGRANDRDKAVKKEEGIYLDDLANDPARMAEYFGKRNEAASVSSNNIDSGRVSLGTSPCSPSILSLNDDATVSHSDTISTLTKEEPHDPVAHKSSITTLKDDVPFADGGLKDTLKTKKHRYGSGSSEISTASTDGLSEEEIEPLTKKAKPSLRLSSDQLKQLDLKYGSNEARFSITTRLQGTAWCSCYIYLYKWDEQLVISDIDGTITKSDVLGHVIPAIGGTWAQAGVAELYSRIEQNGYKMIYLSSRAIGQSHYTKTYLKSIIQGSKTLPDGPLLLSPTSVLMALRKEVIERRPDEFKISCLSDLKSLFPVERPFFAGFGNRETDIKSYLAVGIPPKRILIINAYGLVKRADKSGYTSDYITMAMDTVDYTFPPVQNAKIYEMENSSFSVWNNEPNRFAIDEEELKRYEGRRQSSDKIRKQSKKTKSLATVKK